MIADLPHLRKLSGLKRRSDIRRWLRKNGVSFMVQPSGDPVTTLDAINRAMYGNSKFNKPDFTPPPCSRPKSTKGTVGTTTSIRTSGTRCRGLKKGQPVSTQHYRLGLPTDPPRTGN